MIVYLVKAVPSRLKVQVHHSYLPLQRRGTFFDILPGCRYLNSLLKSPRVKVNKRLEIRQHEDQRKGKGVFALEPVLSNELLFVEAPVASANILASDLTRALHADDHEVFHDQACSRCMKALIRPEHLLPPFLAELAGALPLQERFWPVCNEIVEDKGEVFCSQTCRVAADKEFNQIIQVNGSPSPVLMELKNLCRMIKTVFPLMVLRMYAALVIQAKAESKRSLAWEETPFANFYTSPEELSVNFSVDSRRHSLPNYQRHVYHSARHLIEQIVTASCGPEYVQDQGIYNRLYNSVHLNCTRVYPRSPFSTYASHVKRVRPLPALQKISEAVIALNNRGWEELIVSDHKETAMPKESVFNRLSKSTGSGLFAIHSSINHSCRPNTCIRSVTDDYRISAFASADIAPGEEICIDYVGFSQYEPALSKAQRNALLSRYYKFTCCCPVCLKEQ